MLIENQNEIYSLSSVSTTGKDEHKIDMTEINEPATDEIPINWRIIHDVLTTTDPEDDGKVISCTCSKGE